MKPLVSHEKTYEHEQSKIAHIFYEHRNCKYFNMSSIEILKGLNNSDNYLPLRGYSKMMGNFNKVDDLNNIEIDYKKIVITYGMINHMIYGFKDKNIYAYFEAKNNEIKITPLLKALYTCKSEYVSNSSIKGLQLKLLSIS